MVITSVRRESHLLPGGFSFLSDSDLSRCTTNGLRRADRRAVNSHKALLSGRSASRLKAWAYATVDLRLQLSIL